MAGQIGRKRPPHIAEKGRIPSSEATMKEFRIKREKVIWLGSTKRDVPFGKRQGVVLQDLTPDDNKGS